MSDTFLPDSHVHRHRGFARSLVFSAARGALLIALAVVIGVVLLQVIDTGKGPGGKGSGAAAGTKTTTTTTTATGPQTTGATGVTTTAKPTGPVKQPGQLTVVVLNASGVNGAAATTSKQLAAKGYQMGKPATASTRQTGTTAACTAGLDREAAALAAAVGPAAKVVAFPTPAPTGASTSNCIVTLGS
ncbi:MAG: LytR C-terminal domain-containing protein [Acidimicrobiia bacterium]